MDISLRMGLGSIATMGGGAAPFTPPDLGASLLARWTADDAASLTLETGSKVSSWRDQVAAYDAVQATDANRPVYSATSFNGHPGLSFNGTTHNLNCTAAGLMAALPSGAAAGELWVIVSQDSLAADTSTRRAVAYGAGSANTARRLGRTVVSAVNRGRGAVGTGAALTSITDAASDFSGRYVVRMAVGADTTTIYMNDEAGTPGAVVPGTAVATRFRIGCNDGGAAEFWEGQISEIFATGPLTTDQAAALMAYALPRRYL